MNDKRFPVYFFTGVSNEVLSDQQIHASVENAATISRLMLGRPAGINIIRTEVSDSVYYTVVHVNESLHWVGYTHQFIQGADRPMSYDNTIIRSSQDAEHTQHRNDIGEGIDNFLLFDTDIMSSTIYELKDFLLHVYVAKFEDDELYTVWTKINRQGTEIIATPEEHKNKIFVDYMTIVNHFYSEDDQEWVIGRLTDYHDRFPPNATPSEISDAYYNNDKQTDVDMVIFSVQDITENELMMMAPSSGKVATNTCLENGFVRIYSTGLNFDSINAYAMGIYYYDGINTGVPPQRKPIHDYLCCLSSSGQRIVKQDVSPEVSISYAFMDAVDYHLRNGISIDGKNPPTQMKVHTVDINGHSDLVVYYGDNYIVFDHIYYADDERQNYHRIVVTGQDGRVGVEPANIEQIREAEKSTRFIPYEIMMYYISEATNVSKAN